jgi:hypothetical protein
MDNEIAYAPASTHENSLGLRARFEKVNPNWNKRPGHLESREAVRERVSRRAETPNATFQEAA